MKGETGEWQSAFARHTLPGRGYVPLPVCLRVVRRAATYDPARPPFSILADLVSTLRRLTGASNAVVRGYWAPDSPLSAFHGAHGWVELVLEDQPVIALVPVTHPPASARAYPAFVQKTALACLQEWARNVQ